MKPRTTLAILSASAMVAPAAALASPASADQATMTGGDNDLIDVGVGSGNEAIDVVGGGNEAIDVIGSGNDAIDVVGGSSGGSVGSGGGFRVTRPNHGWTGPFVPGGDDPNPWGDGMPENDDWTGNAHW